MKKRSKPISETTKRSYHIGEASKTVVKIQMGSITRLVKKVIAHGDGWIEVRPGEDFNGLTFDDLVKHGLGELATPEVLRPEATVTLCRVPNCGRPQARPTTSFCAECEPRPSGAAAR